MLLRHILIAFKRNLPISSIFLFSLQKEKRTSQRQRIGIGKQANKHWYYKKLLVIVKEEEEEEE